MKKVVMLVFAVAMLFVGMVGVRAAGTVTEVEANLAKVLKDTYTIGNDKFTLPEGIKVQIDRYLSENDVTQTDADYICNKIKYVTGLIEEKGIKDIKDLSRIKSDIIDAFEDVLAETSIDGTYKDGQFIIYEPGTTTVFATVDSLVKQTGTESNAIAILAGVSFVVMVAGAFVIVRKVRFN